MTMLVLEPEPVRWYLLTFRGLQSPDVSFQFVNGFHVLVVLDTIKDDSSASLQVDLPFLEHHGPDGDTSVHVFG